MVRVKVYRDGKIYFQRYEKASPLARLSCGKVPKTQTGTITTFKYDPAIFKGDESYKYETLVQRFYLRWLLSPVQCQ